jgi:hypothetical protein
MIMEQNPVVTIKKKNLHVIIDYCVESKLEFIVRPKLTGDEFDVEVSINNIHQAILFGMFLRENRLMPNGMQHHLNVSSKAKVIKTSTEKSIDNSSVESIATEESKEEPADLFDETLNLNL